MSEKFIYWFEELDKNTDKLAGKKCANLGGMIQIGLPVPPGFAISIEQYRNFIQRTGAEKEMIQYVDGLGDLREQGIAVFDVVSKRIQRIIEEKVVPPEIKDCISEYYDELCQKLAIPHLAVSVRSSGTESRPGMFDTYLNVTGVEAVLDKIKKVWASAYTVRAVAYRINKELPLIGDELGIAIPKMINARAAGITFTADPVTGDTSKMIIEANWGLGEGVVSGAESVDGFIVDKNNLEIIERHIGRKTRCVLSTRSGVEWKDLPVKMQTIPCLSDEEVREIARVGLVAERKLGVPQDMEWAVDKDLSFPQSIFYLQTRPAKIAKKKSSLDQILHLMVGNSR